MECRAQCPYCWEVVEVLVDIGGGGQQSYVEDCSVCCRPWQVHASLSDEGEPSVTLSRHDA
jgi:Cysteine-rich CPXCG